VFSFDISLTWWFLIEKKEKRWWKKRKEEKGNCLLKVQWLQIGCIVQCYCALTFSPLHLGVLQEIVLGMS